MSDKDGQLVVPAVEVTQPLGTFLLTALQADVLLEVSYAEPAYAHQPKGTGPYGVGGVQREPDPQRYREISAYIERVDATFPTSVILAANYVHGEVLEDDDPRRWSVRRSKSGGVSIVIPTREKVVSIVDGQHRLGAFRSAPARAKQFAIACSVFFDLPNPLQAYLFATVNFNQKRVDKSLAYELFGADIEDAPPVSWSPEKVAVSLVRELNTDTKSPFRGHIIVAAVDEDEITTAGRESWRVSTAAVVDGILRLISTKPARDRDLLGRLPLGKRRRDALRSAGDDKSPLRELYYSGNDLLLYTLVQSFFAAAADLLLDVAPARSMIRRTVGIQALFDCLRDLAPISLVKKNVSTKFFGAYLRKASRIDFTDDYFSPSGKGRVGIRKALQYSTGLRAMPDDEPDRAKLKALGVPG